METSKLIERASLQILRAEDASLAASDYLALATAYAQLAIAQELKRANDWQDEDDKYKDYLRGFSHLQE
jgi:hypothetical protein